jgi:hypothetical protein
VSEIAEGTGSRTLSLKIGRDDLLNLANSRLFELADSDLAKTKPELSAIAEAEFCVALVKAIAHNCTRVVIDIEAESILARGPVAGADG